MRTLLNISPAKNGTTSVFDFLKHHPDIYSTEIKELQYSNGQSWLNLKKYYSSWSEFPKRGIYLDATPNLFTDFDKHHFDEIKDKLIFDNYKLIYLLKSYQKYFVSVMFADEIFSKHFLYSDQLQRAERMIGIENIFVCNLIDIEKKQEKLWEFLNVKNVELKMPWENKTEIKQKYISWYKKSSDFKIMFEDDMMKIKEKYGVEIE